MNTSSSSNTVDDIASIINAFMNGVHSTPHTAYTSSSTSSYDNLLGNIHPPLGQQFDYGYLVEQSNEHANRSEVSNIQPMLPPSDITYYALFGGEQANSNPGLSAQTTTVLPFAELLEIPSFERGKGFEWWTGRESYSQPAVSPSNTLVETSSFDVINLAASPDIRTSNMSPEVEFPSSPVSGNFVGSYAPAPTPSSDISTPPLTPAGSSDSDSDSNCTTESGFVRRSTRPMRKPDFTPSLVSASSSKSSPSVDNRRARRANSSPYAVAADKEKKVRGKKTGSSGDILIRNHQYRVPKDTTAEEYLEQLKTEAMDWKYEHHEIRCPLPSCGHVQGTSNRMSDMFRHIETHFREKKQCVLRCLGKKVTPGDPSFNAEKAILHENQWYMGGCYKAFSRPDSLRRHLREGRNQCLSDLPDIL